MAATYKDIQRRTGLSLATISKYFNGRNVLDENRAAIEEAVAALGFQVNQFARGLRTRRSRSIGVLIPEINNVFHTTIIRGIEEVLREKNYGLVICSRGPDVQACTAAVDFLLGKMVDGIIAIPMAGDSVALEQANARNIPVVLVDRLLEDFPAAAVVVDNVAAARLAVRRLANAGHQRIGLLCGPGDVWTMQQRRTGYEDAMREHGLTVRDSDVFSGVDSMQTAIEGVAVLTAGADPVTAVFATTYTLTLGAVIALNEVGLSMPGDISVVGMDSLELAQAVRPRLDMVIQPVEQIAAEAARTIHDRIVAPDDPAGSRVVVLPARLVEGDSVSLWKP